MAEDPTAPVPIWRYSIILGEHLPNDPPITIDAVGYEQDGPWTVFDDTFGTVLTRRTDTILEVRRSPEPVSHQRADLV